MNNYENVIMDALDGDTPKQKHLSLMKLYDELVALRVIKSPWIPVKLNLPEIFENRYSNRVLCLTTSRYRAVGYLLHGEWHMDAGGKKFSDMGYEITHWLYMPD